MHLDPRRLAALRAVADAGGVLAAAKVLHLTPSAVSQHLARLEAETGVTLLDRSRADGRRAVGLTPAGRLLAEHAGRVAVVLAEAERDLAELTGQVTGRVVVAAFPTAMEHLVGPAAAAVHAGSPHVRVSVREFDPEPALAALRAGGVDLVITETYPDARPPGLGGTWLLDDGFRVVTPPDWGSGVEGALTRPWVSGSPGSAARVALDRLAARYDVVLRREHECLEFPAALALVSAGLAAAVVPGLAVPAELPAGVRVLEASALGARRIGVLHRAGRHEPNPAARQVLDAITARAARVTAGSGQRAR
ncbi:LysR family transcriptional regulator [Cryptosporangium aurantiacum]|uniref:DNA-binding transcriptional regulator, LysR family n=1 Tax=Cryptosporangium aurantiacum TaxID=134849 RepID=A0A1M7RMP9_9ACTN|nr:LysR family transcriptional regulator [Cryptosporangium aurantiacum]SHN47479.1 DNA-binding transcriptional regulator, LysR family [Cryptosporangium aurantiacum]